MIEEIEKAKALERKSVGGKGGFKEEVDGRPPLPKGKSRDIIGEKVGMSGRQLSRAKYIADNATPEILEQLDSGEKAVNSI